MMKISTLLTLTAALLATGAQQLLAEETNRVYFNNWGTTYNGAPHIYAWGDGDNNNNGTYPGVAMTQLNQGVYYADLSTSLTTFIINKGSDGDNNKLLSDVAVKNNYIYLQDGKSGIYRPETLYLAGSLTTGSSDWTIDNTAPSAIGVDGVYTFNGVALAGADGANAYFSFVTAVGDWTAANASTRFGASTKDEALTVGTAANLICAIPSWTAIKATGETAYSAEPYAFTIAEGNYIIKVDLNQATVTVENEPENGINEVEAAADAAPVYYNLQGMRVEGKPAAGLYVVRQGARSSKVLVR